MRGLRWGIRGIALRRRGIRVVVVVAVVVRISVRNVALGFDWAIGNGMVIDGCVGIVDGVVREGVLLFGGLVVFRRLVVVCASDGI